MTTQLANLSLQRLIEIGAVGRNEPNFAWGQAASSILALPALRAFWPMSSVDYTVASRARDIAGGGYHLSDNNTPVFGYDQLAPYVEFDGVDQYLSRADGGGGNWADILGTEAYVQPKDNGLTLGAWVNFDRAIGTTERIIGKDDLGAQRSYMLQRTAVGNIRFLVSQNGAAVVNVDSTQSPTDMGGWYLLIGRFEPSTALTVFVNGQSTQNLAGVPANIWDSTTAFTVGASGVPGSYLPGKESLCWLCATALSDSIVTALFHQTRKLYNV